MKKFFILLTLLPIALLAQTIGVDDAQNHHLRTRKGHYEDAAETRAFGDLKHDPPYVPHEGHVRVPIIFVEFLDRPFTLSTAQLQDMYMGQHPIEERPVKPSWGAEYGYGSVQEFFYENSFGKLDFEFEFYGPYTLPQNHEYYGYGQRQTIKRLLTDALPLVDAEIDFTKYDNDGDSICEIVYFVYAGQGCNYSFDNKDIWPTCSLTTPQVTKDGITLSRVGTNNELLLPEGNNKTKDGKALIEGISVFCHEISHGMGIPDLYTSYTWSNYDNNGPEDWDLMDNGGNVCDGFWPTPYTAWERMIMGWIEAEELTTEQDVTVWPLDDQEGRGKAYVVHNPANRDEFWTIENIPSDGWYAGLAGGGTGLIIMHIDYSDKTFSLSYAPNNSFGKPHCTIIPADGHILSSNYVNCVHPDGTYVSSSVYEDNLRGDPYPGSTGATSLAAYHNYAGEEDLVNTMPITDIHPNEDGSVSFHFGGDPTGIRELRPEDADSPVYDLHGRRSGEMQRGGIYVRNGKVVTNL